MCFGKYFQHDTYDTLEADMVVAEDSRMVGHHPGAYKDYTHGARHTEEEGIVDDGHSVGHELDHHQDRHLGTYCSCRLPALPVAFAAPPFSSRILSSTQQSRSCTFRADPSPCRRVASSLQQTHFSTVHLECETLLYCELMGSRL